MSTTSTNPQPARPPTERARLAAATIRACEPSATWPGWSLDHIREAAIIQRAIDDAVASSEQFAADMKRLNQLEREETAKATARAEAAEKLADELAEAAHRFLAYSRNDPELPAPWLDEGMLRETQLRSILARHAALKGAKR